MGLAKAQGTLLQVSIAAAFTTIAQRTKVKLPGGERGEIDATSLDSTAEETLAGLIKSGEIPLTCHYDPAHATHAYLLASWLAGTVEAWKAILTDAGAAELPFSGWIKKFELGEAVAGSDTLVALEITIKITGLIAVNP